AHPPAHRDRPARVRALRPAVGAPLRRLVHPAARSRPAAPALARLEPAQRTPRRRRAIAPRPGPAAARGRTRRSAARGLPVHDLERAQPPDLPPPPVAARPRRLVSAL